MAHILVFAVLLLIYNFECPFVPVKLFLNLERVIWAIFVTRLAC